MDGPPPPVTAGSWRSDSSNLASAMFDAAWDAMLLLDQCGTIHAANPAAQQLLQAAGESLPGQNLYAILRLDHAPEQLDAALQHGARLEAMLPGPIPPQRRVDVRLSRVQASPAAPQGDKEARRQDAVLAVLRNLTPASPSLCQQDQPQEDSLSMEALAGFLGDLRAPLQGVMALAQVLAGTGTSVDQTELLANILHNSCESLRMVALLQDLAQLDSGNLLVSEMPFSPARVLQEVQRRFAPAARRRGLSLHLASVGTMPDIVYGDVDRCLQLLDVLLECALLEQGPGEVRATLALATGEAALPSKNTDASCDMPRAAQDASAQLVVRVEDSRRDAFFQYPSGSSAEADLAEAGTRLGMAVATGGLGRLFHAVARRLARSLGGHLEHAPRAHGVSCYVAAFLPMQLSTTSPYHGDTGVELSPPVPRGWRVLLVDGDPIGRLLVEKLLCRRGHAVTSVGHAEAALDRLSREEFDVVLMELELDGMSGLDATRCIRKGDFVVGDPHVPIIALARFDTATVRGACGAEGMNGVVVKPIETDALLNAMDTAMAAAMARRWNASKAHG